MQSFLFPDPVSWYIGDPVPRWNIPGSGAHLPDGLVISLTTGVTHSVIVYAWELNVNKSGSLDIVVTIKFFVQGIQNVPKSTLSISSFVVKLRYHTFGNLIQLSAYFSSYDK